MRRSSEASLVGHVAPLASRDASLALHMTCQGTTLMVCYLLAICNVYLKETFCV